MPFLLSALLKFYIIVVSFLDLMNATKSHVMGPRGSLEFKQPVHDIRALFEVGFIQALNPGYEETWLFGNNKQGRLVKMS